MTRATGDLHVLSGGAAQGLVTALAPQFLAQTGYRLCTTFGAVGAMREKLLACEPCDVLIVTEAMINELVDSGHVIGESRRALGCVRTGIAVRAGDELPDISDRAALQRSLRAASEIYLPDPQRATAGIHFAKVLRQLNIDAEVAGRLRPYPNGTAAMAAMGQSTSASPIGCTQLSEIRIASGVTPVGPLPAEFELATVYSVAVCASSPQPDIARRFSGLLAESGTSSTRAQAGFEPLSDCVQEPIR